MFAALKGLPPRNHSTIAINLLVKRVLLASVSLHFLEKSFLKFSCTAFPLNQLGVITEMLALSMALEYIYICTIQRIYTTHTQPKTN